MSLPDVTPSTVQHTLSGRERASAHGLAIGPSVITFFLVQKTTLKIGATRVQAYSYLIPAIVLVMDWVVGRGLPTLMTLPGIAIVIGASLLIQRGAIHEGSRTLAR